MKSLLTGLFCIQIFNVNETYHSLSNTSRESKITMTLENGDRKRCSILRK